MSNFYLLFKLNFYNLIKNPYALFFSSLSLLSILFVLYFQLHPTELPLPSQKPSVEKQNQPSSNSSPITPTSSLQLYATLIHKFFVGFLVILSSAFLGSKAIRAEIQAGVLELFLLRPISRVQIYLAKYFALITTLFCLFLPAFIGTFILLFGIQPFFLLFYGIAVLLLAISTYVSIFLCMGMFRWGMYISVGYALFWEILISFLGRAKTFSIAFYLRSLTLTLLQPVSTLHRVVSTHQAIFYLLIIILIALAIGSFIFKHKEFSTKL